MALAPEPVPTPCTPKRAWWAKDDSVELVGDTVGALLARRTASHPDRVALVGVPHGSGQQLRLTYKQLFDEAARVATALAGLTEHGDYVALWAPNVIEWPIVQYGAALAGVVLVAINPALRDDELHYALAHSGASLLLHADVSRDYDMAAAAARVAARLPGLRCVSLSQHASWRAPQIDERVIAAAPSDPDAAVMLQYTSGTTGRPKGVLLHHKGLVNVAKLTLETVGVAEGAVCLNPLPMFHTAGCVIATLGPLWVGGTVVLVDRFVAEPVLGALRDERVSVLFYVPAILGALLACQREGDTPAPQLDIVMGGASNVPPAMIEEAEWTFRAVVINLFGQTELSPVLSGTRPGDSRRDQLTTVGRPLPLVECKVIDPNTGDTVNVGEPGEICARGYQQFLGYLHDSDATARAVDVDGFVHTGDLGTMDERGYLSITGRLKELIIRGGENIAPAEVETALLSHDSVADAAVVGVPDERLGELVAAVIRTDRVADGDLRSELTAHLRARLAPFKVPTRWFVVDALPVTPTGKVQKFQLREKIGQDDLREFGP